MPGTPGPQAYTPATARMSGAGVEEQGSDCDKAHNGRRVYTYADTPSVLQREHTDAAR